MFVHFPLALLPASLICDIVNLAGRGDFRPVADGLLVAGVIAAIPAALAGMWDFITHGASRPPRRRVAIAHFGANALALVAFLLSWIVRAASDLYGVAVVISAIGTMLLAIGGYLGGRLVYAYGVGVAPEVPYEPGIGQGTLREGDFRLRGAPEPEAPGEGERPIPRA